MKGDFSRLTFDQKKHYSSVRMQQGRVQLDADWNEQIDILRHYLETQLKDLIGHSGAPEAASGFKITLVQNRDEISHTASSNQAAASQNESPEAQLPDFHISAGRYYVDGILCENERSVLFSEQADFPGAALPSATSEVRQYFVYLDVWQRHLTAVEDPALREVALGGPDTATRTQTVWQVKLLPVPETLPGGSGSTESEASDEIRPLLEWQRVIDQWSQTGGLSARRTASGSMLENRLYRVEIHSVGEKGATFKWSRENGSIIFPVEAIAADGEGGDSPQFSLTVGELGRDKLHLQPGDWVELVDDDGVLNAQSRPLFQVLDSPDQWHRQLTLAGDFPDELKQSAQYLHKHPLLRRWDQRANGLTQFDGGAISVDEGTWLELEHGIEVCFIAGSHYRVGDYWLIPARTLSADVEWPHDESGPLVQPPDGILHHYGLLATLQYKQDRWQVVQDLRPRFTPLSELSAVSAVENERQQRLLVDQVLALFRAYLGDVAAGAFQDYLTRIAANLFHSYLAEAAADLFQLYSSAEELEIGDVVAFVPESSAQIEKAKVQNASLVIGVVAGEMNADGRYRVVSGGRARCKVRGKIKPGDLLVPSATDGCAEKGESFIDPGTLIGKSLSAYDGADGAESGLVDIVVTLR